MSLPTLFLGSAGALTGIELASYLATNIARRRFQWVITSRKDEYPEMDEEEIKLKYLGKDGGFDPELGWVRKPNTSGKDKIFCQDENGKWGYRETNWTVNSHGSRSNQGNEKLDNRVLSCYGDSFTFARQVNDSQTWENYLSRRANINALNFGVGNYGLDQSLLRLEREFPKNPTRIVIIGTVADTISRVLSVWKQFYEYGNIWAFKPRFELDENGKLNLVENILDNPSKFNELRRYMPQLREHDFFATEKFDRDLIKFPYLVSLLKNPRRNFGLLYGVLVHQTVAEMFSQKARIAESKDWDVARQIRREYVDLTARLYQNEGAVNLMHALINKFYEQGKRLGFHPVFAFLPQKNEVQYNQGKDPFYMSFFRDISRKIDTIDITKHLLNHPKIDSLYSEDTDYGAHYSDEGNKLISEIMYQELKRKKLI